MKYDLKTQFPDIRDYIEWLDQNCAKCIHQVHSAEYSCKLLEAMDRAASSMTWEMDAAVADNIGLRTLGDYDRGDKCRKFWSKRKKERPPDATDEFS